jgi:hypothetical protein
MRRRFCSKVRQKGEPLDLNSPDAQVRSASRFSTLRVAPLRSNKRGCAVARSENEEKALKKLTLRIL